MNKNSNRRIPKSGKQYRTLNTEPENTKEFRDWVKKGKPADDLPVDNRVRTKQARQKAIDAEVAKRAREMGTQSGRVGPSTKQDLEDIVSGLRRKKKK